MSAGLELIPIAIAIGVAVKEKRKARAELAAPPAASVYAMETRIRDGELLSRALGRLGATTDETAATLSATLEGTPVSFAIPSETDVYDAHFADSVPEERARDLVLKLDQAYCTVVQQSVRDKVITRAAEHGFALSSEAVEEDGSLVLTVEVTQ